MNKTFSRKIVVFFIGACTVGGCAQDKQMHFGAGAITAAVVSEYTDSKLAGCGAALAVGLAKEYVVDINTHGQPDFNDAVATVAGCTILAIEF